MDRAPYDDVVTIQYVSESRTKVQGLRRWVIGAERTTGQSVGERLIGLTTLDPLKASLCIQARDKKFQVQIKHRKTAYFDDDLLWVGLVKAQVSA